MNVLPTGVAFLAALAVTTAAAQQSVSIEGAVADPAGRPVAGLTVNAADLSSSSGATGSAQTSSDGSFRISVPAGIYLLATVVPPRPLNPSLLRVDASAGSVTGVQIRLSAQTKLVPDDPPRAALIQVSPPDATGEAIVIGAPGAVAPGAFLVLVTLDTGDTVTTQAAADGSFRASTFAPAGASVMIKADPFGLAYSNAANAFRRNGSGPQLSLLAGTIVRSSDAAGAVSGLAFSRSGIARLSVGPILHSTWTFHGTISSATVQPGSSVRMEGIVRLVSNALQQAGSMRIVVGVSLDKVSGPDGTGSLAQNTFASTLLTPTGFPIERERNGFIPYNVAFDLLEAAPDRAEASVRLDLNVPDDQPPGFYVPVTTVYFDNVPAEPSPARLRIAIERSGRRNLNTVYLPVIKVGDPQPPRIPATLLTETISNGTRGVRAVEDRNHFALSSRIQLTETLIVPRVDATGEPILYRLEPFLPTIGLVVAGQPSLPLIPFRFPSGELTVRVQSPDGASRVIGPAPFVQPRLQSRGLSETSLRDFFGGPFATVFTLITECYQLTTLDPRFSVQFDRDGKYVITLDGAVDDLWGNRWRLGGTYELHVGRALSVGTAVVPGTPFEVGDIFDPSVLLDPPVAADVEVRVQLLPGSDRSRMVERVVRGRANRFGVFSPVGSGIAFDQPGEYRVEITASFIDNESAMWIGSRTWGNVVAPRQSPIIAHGRRGMVNTQVLGTPWFFRAQTPFPTLPHQSHPNPPFFSGDVFWAQKSDTAFVLFTFQDPSRLVTDRLRARQRDSVVFLRDPGTFEDRELLGELPLFSSRADQIDPHVDPSGVDLWGYSYRFVERPMIAVRELIAEDGVQLAYWPFHDPYAGQIGMGGAGDLPNDFKFYFGGVVLRGAALERPLYAIYSSLFVLVTDQDRDGSRVLPPFQGNGGGPDGGPLFTLKGKEIDLFFHATSIRPGTVLVKGNRISFAGYSAPTLPSTVEIAVTSPAGLTRTIRGQANPIGYFHDSSQEFTADEAGVWKAKVTIVFDGRTSAGQLTAPFPSGGVLGSREGEFYFYVVEPNAPQLEIAAMPQFVRPADGRITFRIQPPAGLSNVQLTYTTTMPGFLLEERTQTSMNVVYDAPTLAKDFPNLDLHDADGFAGADTITISIMLSGKDPKGATRHFARQIVIQGEELHMPDQSPRPKRRAVR